MYPSLKAYIPPGTTAEAASKKTMPGVDYDQFDKDLNKFRAFSRQKVYYLIEYAVKGSTTARVRNKHVRQRG